MSDSREFAPSESERRLLEQVDRLARGEAPLELGSDEERRVAETLAALAELEPPRAPRAGLREEVLAALPSSSAAPRAPRWLPMAAVLAFALVGFAGWQFVELERQRDSVAALQSELLEALRQGRESGSALAESRARLAMMTTPGAEFCLLKPVGDEPLYPAARATLVLAANGRDFYLRVQGLDPCEKGGAYQLWFHTVEGARAGPQFRVSAPGEEIELTAAGAPPGIRSVAITLESDADESPDGPRVLFADEAMRFL